MASDKLWNFKVILIPVLVCCLYPPVCARTNPDQSISFDQNNFIVFFNPFVAPDDAGVPDAYNEQDLLPMVEKISSKFAKIFANSLTEYDIDKKDSRAFISTAVAKFNALHNNTLQMPLSVFMVFERESSTTFTQNKSSFNIVFEIAERANSIYPGTVEYLLYEDFTLNALTLDRVMAEIKDSKEKLEGDMTKHEYKLGAIVPLFDCGKGANVRDYLIPVLDQIQLIVFEYGTGQEDYDAGVDETFVSFTIKFQRCENKIKKSNPMIEVGFRVHWPDTDFRGKQNVSNLVVFWGKMNEWATMTDSKVFMFEAFNQPYRANNTKHQGWWKLKYDSKYVHSAQYIYEDKVEAAIRGRSEEIPINNFISDTSTFAPPTSTEKPGGSVSSTVIISVTTSGLFLAVAGAIMFLMYKNVMRKMDIRQQNVLTKEEVKEFFEGMKRVSPENALEAGEGMGKSLDVAYNNEYELPPTSFTVDETSALGMGAFGIVCRGKVFKESTEVEVAVKMVKKACPPTALKGLLSEIKVLSYLGNHENVVCLIGAYTNELRKGKVYVFTELCCLGSLEKYLREYKPPQSTDLGAGNSTETSYLLLRETGDETAGWERGQKGQLHFKDLHRWSFEIASGMEFLSSKHVVHADLATRNILLLSDMSAKISDFGLSRRLYDYTNYVKSEQEPLPWRWMAPESLRRLEFNERTDVWAYGVTLWEIYSLGDVPYPGLSWSMDFATKLMSGLKLEEPRYNSDNMYTVMLKCWNVDPVKRPIFAQIKEDLSRLMQ